MSRRIYCGNCGNRRSACTCPLLQPTSVDGLPVPVESTGTPRHARDVLQVALVDVILRRCVVAPGPKGYSPTRRWLRSTAAADNWARFLDEMAERDRELRREQSANLSAALGYEIEVGPPRGFTFPHFAEFPARLRPCKACGRPAAAASIVQRSSGPGPCMDPCHADAFAKLHGDNSTPWDSIKRT